MTIPTGEKLESDCVSIKELTFFCGRRFYYYFTNWRRYEDTALASVKIK